MSVLVQYLKFLKSSPGENEKKEKTAELPGYAPSVAGSIDNEKKDEDKLTSSITDHGLASQETPKNINASSAEPVTMRSSSSAAAPAFTQPVANPGRGYNTSVPRPQTQQQPTKIPRVLERIPMANSVNDPRSGTLLDKQGSLGYSRNTGISDVEGEIYVNGSDVELLGKLGFEYSCEEYLGLEKTSEVLDVYSYIEKVAGVPREVAKLIDSGKAFSGEYLKDMGYGVPKGYEVKGDLVCPVEKKARQKYSGPPILGGNKPAFPTFNAPAVTPQQQPAYQLQKLSEADHPVTSSNIKAVGHDKKEKVLDVAFHSGSEYAYKNVPRSLYDRLLKAKSPGKFFNKHIKKDKPFEYEKVAGIPEHLRKAIATGDKALLQAAQSKSVASRIANIAAKKRKLEVAKLLGNEEPKLLQRGEEFQKHFPFSVSHEFEQAKKTVDPSYRPDLSKYLGKPKV